MPRFVKTGILGSLERLQLEYVDIVLISRDADRVCTIEEIVRACTFVVNQGWAFYWGTSGWSADDIMVSRPFFRHPCTRVAVAGF